VGDAARLPTLALAFAAGTTAILVTQLATLAAFSGIGLLLQRSLGARPRSLRCLFVSAWIGWALTILALMAWNFLAPISGAAWICILALGAFGIAAARHDLRALRPQLSVLIAGSVLLLGYWEANLSLARNGAWDSGLYHIQAVQWARAFPVVPGLANLHGPLGFNNSGVLLFAMLDSGFWHERAAHLANGMAVLLLGSQAIVGLSRWRGGSSDPSTAAFDAMLLGPALFIALRGHVSSFTTDVAASAFVLALGSVIFQRAVSSFANDAERRHSFVACLTLAAAAVTMRSNLGFYAVGASILLAVWEIRDARPRIPLATFGLGLALAGAFAACWMGRGVMLSGYPLFPTTFLATDFDWRVPAEHAIGEYAFAAYTEREFAWSYAPRWLAHVFRNPFAAWLPLLVALVLLGWRALALRGRAASALRFGAWPLAERRSFAILLPVFAALVAWFLTVPATRYALALFWTVPAVVLGCLAAHLDERATRAARWAALALGVLPIFADPVLGRKGSAPLVAIFEANLNSPGPDLFFHPIRSQPKIEEFVTDSGLSLNRVGSHCWAAPIPCTPNPSPGLRQRKPGDLAAGFTVDGTWRMQNWPYGMESVEPFLSEWRERFLASGALADSAE